VNSVTRVLKKLFKIYAFPTQKGAAMKEQKSTPQVDVVRAWKDPEYRASLSDVEQAQLPNEASGLIELEHLEHIRGGGPNILRQHDETARNIIAGIRG
jgi:mersacidin/lichenicidin family type 2 lantibiotic